jgi:hypothetical protein
MEEWRNSYNILIVDTRRRKTLLRLWNQEISRKVSVWYSSNWLSKNTEEVRKNGAFSFIRARGYWNWEIGSFCTVGCPVITENFLSHQILISLVLTMLSTTRKGEFNGNCNSVIKFLSWTLIITFFCEQWDHEHDRLLHEVSLMTLPLSWWHTFRQFH